MLFSVLLVQVLVFTHFISTLLMTIDLIVIVAILKLGYLVKNIVILMFLKVYHDVDETF